MRNALNKLADTVTDPAEKKVSPNCSIPLFDSLHAARTIQHTR
jgi:hypothetical protein